MSHVKKVKLSLTATPNLGAGGNNYKSDDELLDTEEYIKGLVPLINPYENS